MSLTLNIRKLTMMLAIIALTMTLLSFIGNLGELYLNDTLQFLDILEVHAEGTIPVWFSVMNLLLAAVLLGLIGIAKYRDIQPYSVHWIFLGLIFVALSIDEMLSLHETLIEPLRDALSTSGLFNSAWVIVAIPLLVILLLAYSRFLLHLPPSTRRGFLFAGAIFVGGAVGIEMFNAFYVDRYSEDVIYFFFTNFEDLCEMIGVIMLIHYLLAYIQNHNKLTLQFNKSRP